MVPDVGVIDDVAVKLLSVAPAAMVCVVTNLPNIGALVVVGFPS